MNNIFVDIVKYFESVISETESIFANISDEVCNKKPEPNSWSAIQVIEHLNITARKYLKDIQPKFRDTSSLPKGDTEEIKFTLCGKLLKMFGPEGKIKIKAPSVFRPIKVSLDRISTLDEFYKIQEEIISLAKTCAEENIDVNKIKIASPVSSFVKVNLGEFFIFTLGHEQRHLNQVKRILKSLSD